MAYTTSFVDVFAGYILLFIKKKDQKGLNKKYSFFLLFLGAENIVNVLTKNCEILIKQYSFYNDY